MRGLFLCLAMVFVLSGCVEGPEATKPPEMTFSNFKPVELNVARIEIRNDYKPPMQDPNIEHKFQTPPYKAAENLIKKQLTVTGRGQVLRVIIDDASVIREELPLTKGFMGVFMYEPAERLKAKVLLRFELFDPKAPDVVLGNAEIIAKRTRTLIEGSSPSDHDHAYFSLTEDLMDDLNDGLRSVVKNTFGK